MNAANKNVVHLILPEILEYGLVLDEDGVVGLQIMFGQQLRLDGGGNVEQGVAHTKQHTFLIIEHLIGGVVLESCQ